MRIEPIIAFAWNPAVGIPLAIVGLIVVALFGLVAVGDWLMPLSAMDDPLTLATFWTRPILLLFVAGIGFAVLAERRPRWVSIPYPFALMLRPLFDRQAIMRARVPIHDMQ